jgi:hypothetical protein
MWTEIFIGIFLANIEYIHLKDSNKYNICVITHIMCEGSYSICNSFTFTCNILTSAITLLLVLIVFAGNACQEIFHKNPSTCHKIDTFNNYPCIIVIAVFYTYVVGRPITG